MNANCASLLIYFHGVVAHLHSVVCFVLVSTVSTVSTQCHPIFVPCSVPSSHRLENLPLIRLAQRNSCDERQLCIPVHYSRGVVVHLHSAACFVLVSPQCHPNFVLVLTYVQFFGVTAWTNRP
jgi:hypothetical protein